MFKGLRNLKPQTPAEPIIEGDLTALVASFMEISHDITYNNLVRECSNIGNRYLITNFYIPPFIGRPIYIRYEGNGTISVDRTIQEICTNGRRLDSIVTRKHVKDKQRTSLAILIDNSAQMTADWLGEKLGEDIKSEETPLILIKIAAISILESLGRRSDEIDIIIFGDEVKGPFNRWQLHYKELLKLKGSGLSRLDLGLASLLQLEWEMRPGSKLLFILGGGLPYTGRNILIDDMEIQVNVMYYLNRMMRQGVKVVYFPFFTKKEHLDERVGAFSPKSLANKMGQMGVSVAEIDSMISLPHGLRNGFIHMLMGPDKEMPVFEL